jgi:polyketide biosynthesis enoyl-CoA hydratase PksH
MTRETIIIEQTPRTWTLTFNRPARRNALNRALMQELAEAFRQAEADSDCRLIVLQGQGGFFCTGMDFEEAAQGVSVGEALAGQEYINMLRHFATSPKIVIAKVEGSVLAGGIGLVAASDFVVATPESSFGLPEALWGLLPACVAPYLIRRVGFQHAYRMTLTTENLSADEAHRIALVDIVSNNPDDAIRKLLLRVGRLTDETTVDAKQYFRKMWLVTAEMEQNAVAKFSQLVSSTRVQENIRNYVEHQRFPWER